MSAVEIPQGHRGGRAEGEEGRKQPSAWGWGLGTPSTNSAYLLGMQTTRGQQNKTVFSFRFHSTKHPSQASGLCLPTNKLMVYKGTEDMTKTN